MESDFKTKKKKISLWVLLMWWGYITEVICSKQPEMVSELSVGYRSNFENKVL